MANLDLSALTTEQQIAAIYIGYYDRAGEPDGSTFWEDTLEADNGFDLAAIASDFGTQDETLEAHQFFQDPTEGTANAFITDLYLNLFNRDVDNEGLTFWSDILTGVIDGETFDSNGDGNADITEVGDIILAIIQGAQNVEGGPQDQTTILNKIGIANAWTDAAKEAGATAPWDELSDDVQESASTIIEAVDDDAATVDAAKADIETQFPVITQGETFPLTQRADDLAGTDQDDTFSAPVTQNETGSGELANTFETGDVLNGGEGTDTLEATMIASGAISGAGVITPPIAAETTGIENVFLTSQQLNLVDASTNPSPIFGVTVDAGNMTGVEQWWSDNSRADILIEDIESNPTDTAFGMRETDPNVSFRSYFNANFLDGGVAVGESAFNFTISEDGAVADEIANITVIGVRFDLEGETYELEGDDVEAADTWADLQTALQAEVDSTDGLDGLVVAHQGNGQFTVTDPNGGDFMIDPAGTVITSSTTNEVKDASLGGIETTAISTETDIFLDNAGNGSQGGSMDVGTMSGDRGVEIFNVNVLDDSHIVNLASSNLRTNEQHLEEVYVEGEGSLFLGASTINAGISTTTDDRLGTGGLVNVRVFDASGFEQELKVGATLNNNAISRYLDDAEEPVQFTYNLGDAGTNLSLTLSNNLTSDDDFMLEINGGAQDDRINLSGNYLLDAVSIDGGEGRNTLEVTSDIGVDDDSTPAAFDNIQKLVLAGTGTVDADMAELAGVEELVVAGNLAGFNSQIDNLEADTTVSISGKNQTLGNNSNADQTIGTVTLEDAQSTTQAVDLDNTARNSGTLTVGAILVTESATGTSEVDELLLSSNGVRDTENVVQDIQADDASDVTFVGTQALSAHVSSLATGTDQELTIDGSALEDDLTLAVNGALLVEGADDVMTGTEGEDDTLALYGGLNTDATVSGFETIQMGWLAGSDLDTFGTGTTPTSGLYDAANTSDAGTYVLGAMNGGIVLDNLSDGVNVIVGDDSAASGQVIGGFNQQITLSGSGSGAINVASVEELDSTNFGSGAHDLMIDNFADVNLDYVRPDDATGASTLNSGLQLDGIDPTAGGLTGLDSSGGAAVFTDGFEVDNVVRNLTITGGDADEVDALILNDVLPASLAVIDVSGYEGAFTADLANAVIEDPNTPGDYLSVNTDTRFVLNDEDVDITLTGLGTGGDAVDFNSIFEFTAAPAAQVGGAPAATWEIENFVAEGLLNSSNDNYSIMDLSDLGIGSFADLDITDDGTDTTVVAEGGDSTWEIVLVGLNDSGDLAPSENFIFA